MANNAFSKEEIVFFDQVLAGFDPNNITARQVSKFMAPGTQFERSSLTIARPVPYISINKDGLSLVEADFANTTQLSVPSTLNANDSAPSDIKNVPFTMNAVELNDPLQRERKAESAVQALSALVDKSIATEIAFKGTLYVETTGTQPAGRIDNYSDVAQAETQQSIRDVPIMAPRTLIMNPQDYNNVSGDLANRSVLQKGVTLTAFERSKIPQVATFDSFKANFMPTLIAAVGTGFLVNGANQNLVPRATDANGRNVDNRTQTLNVDGGTGTVKLGDRFTIAGVNAVSAIHKEDIGELQTFTIIERISATVWTISPGIIAKNATDQASKEYANATTAPADDAVITFLNTVTARANIFFMNQSVEIIHGSLATMDLDGAGVATMRRATDSGIEILFAKGSEITNLGTKYRLTAWFAPNVLIPDMAGILLDQSTP